MKLFIIFVCVLTIVIALYYCIIIAMDVHRMRRNGKEDVEEYDVSDMLDVDYETVADNIAQQVSEDDASSGDDVAEDMGDDIDVSDDEAELMRVGAERIERLRRENSTKVESVKSSLRPVEIISTGQLTLEEMIKLVAEQPPKFKAPELP